MFAKGREEFQQIAGISLFSLQVSAQCHSRAGQNLNEEQSFAIEDPEPYSPMSNPIDNLYNRVKSVLKINLA